MKITYPITVHIEIHIINDATCQRLRVPKGISVGDVSTDVIKEIITEFERVELQERFPGFRLMEITEFLNYRDIDVVSRIMWGDWKSNPDN